MRWREVYDQARALTKDAKSPYEAVAAIESYFQSNYRYDEKADYSQATDGPLPSFFLDGKRGYCQMYAGTMTVILRMLGIPSRIGEGFTEGTRNVSRGTYVVTDRDAHAWVEVWFPKYGWMAFEPTPSRELPFNYSTTSKDFSEAAQSALAGVAGFDSARLEQLAKLAGTPSRVAGAQLGGGRGPREGDFSVGTVVGREWRPGFVSWLLLLAAGVVVLLVLAKRLRSVIPYLRKGPHAIAGAVRRDLEAFVRDQGVPDAVVTLTPDEFARMLRREFGVDAAGWARLQSRARYGPDDARADEAARSARTEARSREARPAQVARPHRARPRCGAPALPAALSPGAPGWYLEGVDDDAPVYELFVRGRELLRAGDTGAAIERLEQARDLDPEKGSIRETLGLAYLRASRMVDAEAELTVALDLAPNDAYCYYLLGRAQQGLGFLELARGSYKMAHWLDPRSDEYRRALDRLPAA